MSVFWAVIVVIVLGFVVYSIISSRLNEHRKRTERAKTLPYIQETVRIGLRYDVQMSDNRRFENVEVLGTSDPRNAQFPLGGWDGLLVLRLENGKLAYVRQNSVRCVVER